MNGTVTANATGTMAVNLHQGKPSHLVLTDPQGRFTQNTNVSNGEAKDQDNPGVSFGAEAKWNQGGTANRLPIMLHGRRLRRNKDDIPPAAGTLTVTLTDGTPVQPVPVIYVEDAT